MYVDYERLHGHHMATRMYRFDRQSHRVSASLSWKYVNLVISHSQMNDMLTNLQCTMILTATNQYQHGTYKPATSAHTAAGQSTIRAVAATTRPRPPLSQAPSEVGTSKLPLSQPLVHPMFHLMIRRPARLYQPPVRRRHLPQKKHKQHLSPTPTHARARSRRQS